MTCIVGVQGPKGAVIGGDSAGVAGWVIEQRADAKVFDYGPFIYGVSGSFRLRDVLRWSFDAPITTDLTVDEYMHTVWIDALRATMIEHGYAKVSDGVESLDDGAFLVAVAGELFEVGPDYQIGRSRVGYHALGCGGEVALGALAATPVDLSPTKRVLRALEAAERHSMGVRGPFTLLKSRRP